MRSSDALFRLIKAMSKGDRRNLKLFARLQDGDKMYIQLFDAIDKQTEYDEEKILKQFEGERFTKQFSVAKNYLYNYILKTLHVFHKDPHMELNTLIHQVRVLMGKNLYDQAHKLIRKAKHMAERQEQFQEMLYLLQYERQIYYYTQKSKEFESFIGSIQVKETETIAKLTNLVSYIQLYDEVSRLLKRSQFARLEHEIQTIEKILNDPLIKDVKAPLSVRASIKRLATISDCHRLRQNYAECLSYTLQMIEVYDAHPVLREGADIRYINLVSNVSTYHYFLGNTDAAQEWLTKLKNLPVKTEHESKRIFEKYYHVSLGICIENGAREEGLAVAEEFLSEIKKIEGKISKAVELAIYYELAYFFMTIGRPEESLPWINRILNEPKTELRTDLQCMARILNLVVHYTLGNHELVEYEAKSASRFITNRGRMFAFERTLLKYLRILSVQHPQERNFDLLIDFELDLEKVLVDENERKALQLFDAILWIKSLRVASPMADLTRAARVPRNS